MGFTALDFAEAARALGTTARAAGHAVPTFRSPPRLEGVERSLRRRPDGGATVSIVLRNRPRAAILADMVEGIVATNGLSGGVADRLRSLLWLGLGEDAELGEETTHGRHNRRFGRPGSAGDRPLRVVRDPVAETVVAEAATSTSSDESRAA